MQNAPPGTWRRRGVGLAPLLKEAALSRSAPSGSSPCTECFSRARVLRPHGLAVVERFSRVRADRAAHERRAPACATLGGALLSRAIAVCTRENEHRKTVDGGHA